VPLTPQPKTTDQRRRRRALDIRRRLGAQHSGNLTASNNDCFPQVVLHSLVIGSLHPADTRTDRTLDQVCCLDYDDYTNFTLPTFQGTAEPFALVFVLVIAIIAWPLIIPVLLAVVAVVIYAYILQHKMHELSETTYRAGALRNATLIESLTALETIKFHAAQLPVFANASAWLYPENPRQACDLLADQLARPVDFVQEIDNMYRSGVRPFPHRSSCRATPAEQLLRCQPVTPGDLRHHRARRQRPLDDAGLCVPRPTAAAAHPG